MKLKLAFLDGIARKERKNMKECSVYLDGKALDIMPADISFVLPTRTARFDLIQGGEIEQLRGTNQEKIILRGILQEQSNVSIQDTINTWSQYAEKSQPVRFIYIGENWELNYLCSIQSPQWKEIGGCFDVEYTLTLHRWSAIEVNKAAKRAIATRYVPSQAQTTGQTYVIKEGDTLSHIAKSILGDSSRWREIYELNKNSIADPNQIQAGQTILVPENTLTSSNQTTTSRKKQKTSKKTTTTKKTTSKSTSTKTTTTTNTTIPKVSTTTGQSGYLTADQIFDQYRRKR